MKTSPDIISPEAAPILAKLFHERVLRSPENCAYRYHERSTGTWHSFTWQQTADQVALWRTALMREGASPAIESP